MLLARKGSLWQTKDDHPALYWRKLSVMTNCHSACSPLQKIKVKACRLKSDSDLHQSRRSISAAIPNPCNKLFSPFQRRRNMSSASLRSHMKLSHKQRHAIVHSWKAIDADEKAANVVIAKHWLAASERCPVWIWGVIGVEESVEKTTNIRFNTLIDQVRGFVTHLVVKLQLDEGACRTAAVQLGQRHRDYFDEGYQQPYFDSFAIATREAIIELVGTHVQDTVEMGKYRHKLTLAYMIMLDALFMNMRQGYMGEAVDNTPNLLHRMRTFRATVGVENMGLAGISSSGQMTAIPGGGATRTIRKSSIMGTYDTPLVGHRSITNRTAVLFID